MHASRSGRALRVCWPTTSGFRPNTRPTRPRAEWAGASASGCCTERGRGGGRAGGGVGGAGGGPLPVSAGGGPPARQPPFHDPWEGGFAALWGGTEGGEIYGRGGGAFARGEKRPLGRGVFSPLTPP